MLEAMQRALILVFATLVLFAIAPACVGGEGDPGGTGGSGSHNDPGVVVLGVTADLQIGVDIDQVHVQMWAADKLVVDKLLTTTSQTSKLELPAKFGSPASPGDTAIKVQVDAFRAGDTQTPLVTRIASTRVIANKTILLRVPIDSRCAVAPGSSAPSCVSPETCISGMCAGSEIDPTSLPIYTPTWSKPSSDICKPTGSAPIVVDVGEGQSDYMAMNDLDVGQVEAGPQGGHHIWVAIRMKGLYQSASITKVTGHFDDINLDVDPFQVFFTFEQDEDGYCKLYGLRFQLDAEHDINDLLGRVLKVTVQITDTDGDVGIGERVVTLSKTTL